MAISSILIATMEATGHGCQYLSALDHVLRIAECFCFVDDTDLVEASRDPWLAGEAILAQVQMALSLFGAEVSVRPGVPLTPKSPSGGSSISNGFQGLESGSSGAMKRCQGPCKSVTSRIDLRH